MSTAKTALIVRTQTPSAAYVIHVETWDEDGYEQTSQTPPMNGEDADAQVFSLRIGMQRHGYVVEVSDCPADLT